MLYLKRLLVGLVSLPIALLIVTLLVVAEVLLLPVIWFFIVVWWVHAYSEKEILAHLLRDIPELLAIHVFKQSVVLAGVRNHVVDVSVSRIEILPAIIVIVDETIAPSRHGFAELGHPRALRKVPERAALLVAKQRPDLAYQVVIEDIHPAVVVVIVGVATHGRDGGTFVVIGDAVLQAGLLERAVA